MAIRSGSGWSPSAGPWRFNPPFLWDGVGELPRVGPRIFMEDQSPHESVSFLLYILADLIVDEAGDPVAGVTVDLYDSITKVVVQSTTSDLLGAYSFSTSAANQQFYIVAYKAGPPDYYGTTINTLTAV